MFEQYRGEDPVIKALCFQHDHRLDRDVVEEYLKELGLIVNTLSPATGELFA